MRLKRFTEYLFRHRWQALALTFISGFVPVIGIVGILYASLVTMVNGVLEGGLFALVATSPYAISFLLKGQPTPLAASISLLAALGVAILSNFLTWIFAVLLYRKNSWSAILQIAALLGVLVVSVIHLLYPDVATWWGQTLQNYYTQANNLAAGALVTSSGVVTQTGLNQTQLEAINMTKYYATGLLTAAILFNSMSQLALARWWQALVFAPGSLARELHNIRLSPLTGILFIASLILSYLGNSVVLDIMPVFYLLMIVAGLSYIHYLFGLMRSPSKWFWILLLYITLIFTFSVSMLVVAFIALFDIWWDGRKRINKV